MSADFTEILAIILMFIGVFFMLVSAVGVLRMPDLFMRMSASTKSSTVGTSCVLLAAALYFGEDLGSTSRIVATILFLFITAPAAAHMIGRAGYYSESKLWEGTTLDELETRPDADRLPIRRAKKAEDRINISNEPSLPIDVVVPDGDDFH